MKNIPCFIKRNWLGILLAGVTLVVLGYFFSYRILEIPLGLTSDEGAFGYNATLLSRTLHDESGKELPVFALSISGKDWRQPVPQYYITLFFKVFGANVFNLRFSSVVITLLSTILIYGLAFSMGGLIMAIAAAVVFVMTPLIMIQSHLGLDNITPVPFTILWLIGMWSYRKTNGTKWIVLAGASLGVAFYSYKGMRALVPVWGVLTYMYIWWIGKWKVNKDALHSFLYLTLSLAPFVIMVPYLNKIYPGALLGGTRPELKTWYDFFYPYLSSLDPSFLFIKGDELIYHSTGRHGMLLFATLPLFVIGAYKAFRKRDFESWVLLAFFSAPLLFGTVGSVHRASRLMAIIPLYALISAIGAKWLYKQHKPLLFIVGLLMLLNYFDFVNYYWGDYPKFSQEYFGDLSIYKDYEIIALEAKKQGKDVFLPYDFVGREDQTHLFYSAAYLKDGYTVWKNEDELPLKGTLLVSTREDIPGMKRLNIELPNYILFERLDNGQ